MTLDERSEARRAPASFDPVADEYGALFEAAWPGLVRTLERRKGSPRVDHENIAGDAVAWGWMHTDIFSGHTATFMQGVLAKVGHRDTLDVYRRDEKEPLTSDLIDRAAGESDNPEDCIRPPLPPVSRHTNGADLFEASVDLMCARLDGQPSAACDRYLDHLSIACERSVLDVRVAARFAALALLADRSWPALGGYAKHRDGTRRVAVYLLHYQEKGPGTILVDIQRECDMSRSTAAQYLREVRATVAWLASPAKKEEGQRNHEQAV